MPYHEDSDGEEQVLMINRPGEGKKGGRGGFFSSVFTVFNSTVGTGILTLPYSFRMAGAGMGIFLLLFFAMVMSLSAYGVVRVTAKTGCTSFQQIVKRLLGEKAGIAMSITIAFYCYLVCVGCLVIVADVSGPLVKHFAGDSGSGSDDGDKWFESRQVAIVVGAIMALPPMLLRDFTSLTFTAFLSFAAVVFVVIVVIDKGHDLTSGTVPGLPPNGIAAPADGQGSVEWGVTQGYKALYAVPNIALSLQCHIQSPGIYSEVNPEVRSPWFFSKVLMFSYMLCVLLYTSCAFFGYVTFREHTPPNIMEAGYDEGNVMIVIARFCLLITAICALPINHHPCRAALRDLLVKKKSGIDDESLTSDSEDEGKGSLLSGGTDDGSPMPVDKFFVMEIAAVWTTMTGLAMLVPNLAVLNDIIGFTAGVSVMFIFPGLFLISLDPFRDTLLASHPTVYRGFGYFFVAFGVTTGIIAAFSFFASIA
eukprot:TRINITY_DN3262_c5_g1_i1.p1 TRINITY_DN3262_c5_g1~~TRINITY_DN3262_c5_g1_i1.p1  ORF type:complete len:478 (+),score=124.25 TRINITY_DN3262_c5_g1_i1:50-1483(+)